MGWKEEEVRERKREGSRDLRQYADSIVINFCRMSP